MEPGMEITTKLLSCKNQEWMKLNIISFTTLTLKEALATGYILLII